MKKTSRVCCAILCFFLLTACSSKDKTKQPSNATKVKEQTTLSNETKELFTYLDATLKAKSLHLQSQQDYERDQRYYQNNTEIKKDGNGGSVISTGDIDNANPKQAHYMVKQITEDSTVVYGEENGYMYNYLKQENGTYNLSQKEATTSSDIENSFLYYYLNYDLLKLTQQSFTCVKDKEGNDILYTLTIKDPDSYIKIYNQKNKEDKIENADISKLHSYKLVFRIRDDLVKSITSDMDYEISIPQKEDNTEYDTYVEQTKLHHYTEFSKINETVKIHLENFKG